jgi:hypothetical protein
MTRAHEGSAFKFRWGKLASIGIIAAGLPTTIPVPSHAQSTARAESATPDLVVPTAPIAGASSGKSPAQLTVGRAPSSF